MTMSVLHDFLPKTAVEKISCERRKIARLFLGAARGSSNEFIESVIGKFQDKAKEDTLRVQKKLDLFTKAHPYTADVKIGTDEEELTPLSKEELE